MILRIVFLSVVIVSAFTSVLAQSFASCSSQQECVPFQSCSDYKSYHEVPPKNWPQSIRTRVTSQLCGTIDRNGAKVYKICCSKKVSTTNSIDLLDFETCGRQTAEKIAFGKNAKVFQFPWMALIKDGDGVFICGGSLITQSHVLTAAHCLRTLIVSVRLGENDISKPIDCNAEDDCAPKAQDIAVDNVIRHPLYSSSKKKNDIGLVKLSKPAMLGDSVQPICLPIASKIALNPIPSEMFISGWGATEHDLSSNILQFAKVPVATNANCAASYSSKGHSITIDESHVCAGGKDRVENCIGDSGGPLQYFTQDAITVQYGVVSYGLQTCGIDNLPGVYAKVSYYMQWILDNLK